MHVFIMQSPGQDNKEKAQAELYTEGILQVENIRLDSAHYEKLTMQKFFQL